MSKPLQRAPLAAKEKLVSVQEASQTGRCACGGCRACYAAKGIDAAWLGSMGQPCARSAGGNGVADVSMSISAHIRRLLRLRYPGPAPAEALTQMAEELGVSRVLVQRLERERWPKWRQ